MLAAISVAEATAWVQASNNMQDMMWERMKTIPFIFGAWDDCGLHAFGNVLHILCQNLNVESINFDLDILLFILCYAWDYVAFWLGVITVYPNVGFPTNARMLLVFEGSRLLSNRYWHKAGRFGQLVNWNSTLNTHKHLQTHCLNLHTSSE